LAADNQPKNKSNVPIKVLNCEMNNDSYYSGKTIALGQNVPSIELKMVLQGRHKSAAADTIVDSGATGNLINQNMARKHQMREHRIPSPIKLINADGLSGSITSTVKVIMTLKNNGQYHTKKITFHVANIGEHNIILQMLWLVQHNPTINWAIRSFQLN
jgi:hypothetical protein